MRKLFLGVVLATIISGCATVQKVPLTANTSAALKDQSIVPVSRGKPDFSAMTPGKAAFAMIGAIAMTSAGNEIVKAYELEDPANSISQGLLQELQSARAAQPVSPAVFVDSNDPEKVATSAKGAAKYVLDVQTINWSFGYFPTDWTHYRVIYSAKARLINVESQKIVAEGRCERLPDSNQNAPTYDELLENKAKILKKELKAAADTCVNSLKIEMLAL